MGQRVTGQRPNIAPARRGRARGIPERRGRRAEGTQRALDFLKAKEKADPGRRFVTRPRYDPVVLYGP